MTRIERRIGAIAVLLAVLSLADGAEAAGKVKPGGPPTWRQAWESVWQWMGPAVKRGAGEDRARKGAGIDPNGAVLKEPVGPVVEKKGAGIDPNG